VVVEGEEAMSVPVVMPVVMPVVVVVVIEALAAVSMQSLTSPASRVE
jgi:hypothetical protein